jgi:hypothetical protein
MSAKEGTVVVCGANQYLRLEGSAPALRELLAHLERDLGADDDHPEDVTPEPQKTPAIKPVCRVGIRSTTGPVTVQIEADVAWLVGGRRELIRMLDQMKGMIDRGPEHFEILRVFDDWYDYIDAATHIDFVVT